MTLTPPGVAAGTVYEDTNGNGTQDAGEPGIPNVTVTVTDVNGNPHVLTTDENGNYATPVPAGDTVIDVDKSTLPTGFTQSEGTDTTTVNVPSGGIGSDVDGYKPPENAGTVEGIVYEDTNGNGTQDAGELGIPGVTVTITDTTGGTQVLTTDEDGIYTATVTAGDTIIDIDETTIPGGSTQTEGTDTTTVTVPAGGTATDVDGYQPSSVSAKVTGIIYEDTNGNGTQDAGEPGIPGVKVEVTDGTGNIQTVTTDENGDYSATVEAGDIILNVDETTLPGGVTQTEGTDITTVTILPFDTGFDIDGYKPSADRGALEGVVYKDLNGNGTQDQGEPGIPGVAVTITDSEGGIQTLITDDEGKYDTTVPSGATLVDIEQSDIDPVLTQSEGADPTTVTVPAGGTGTDVDGFAPPPSIEIIKSLNSIADTNGNGVTDTGDTITYGFVVTNTGSKKLDPISIADSKINQVTCVAASLEIGESATCTGDYVISSTDMSAGAIENVAVATGTPIDPNSNPGTPVTDISDAGTTPDGSVIPNPETTETPSPLGESPNEPENPKDDPTTVALTPIPSITVVKSLVSITDTNSNGLTNAGDTISYSFKVSNTGDLVLDPVAVTDSKIANVACAATSLDVGVDTICTGQYVISAADMSAGGVENVATATGTPINPDGSPGTPVTDISDAGTTPDGSPVSDPKTTETPSPLDENPNDPLNPEDDPTTVTLIPPGVVAGTVYEDTNGNGTQDAGEPGIPNVTVTVTDVNGNPHVLTTDENGNYATPVPAGNTVIDIDESTLPTGFTQSEGTDTTTVNVPSGGIGSDVDGYKPPENSGTVTGIVYEDTNGNGTQDSGEPVIPGVTVTITDTTGGIQVLTTDEAGIYIATVPAGTTTIDIDENTIPGGSTQTEGTDVTIVTVPTNGTATDKDGYQPPANSGKVIGVIYDDTNGNGQQDLGEKGIPGVKVEVEDIDGNIQIMTTDENGGYSATVPAGDTILNVDETTLPGGSTQTEGTDITTVTVPPNGIASDKDGYKPSVERGTLEGVVYEDTNGNGTQDPGEPGIPGVDVTVTDSEGGIQTLVTDDDGKYDTTVPSGATLVDIEQSDIGFGLVQTEGTDPTTVIVPAGGIGKDVDGFKPAAPGGIGIVKTVYGNDDPVIGHDSGAGCGTTRASSRAILVDLDKSKDMPVTYCFEVTNTGESYLSNIEITDVTLSVQHSQLTLLNGPALSGLEPGASLLYFYEFTATGSITNTATVEAVPSDPQGHPTGGTVIAVGESTAELVLIIDPPSGIKTVDEEGIASMKWQMVWINDSDVAAPGVTVFDEIPVGTHFKVLPAGANVSSSGVYCETRGSSTTNSTFDNHCYYEAPTATYPRGRVIWKGKIASDPGIKTEDLANNEVVIRFLSVLDNLNLPGQEIENQGESEWDFDDDGIPDAQVPTDNPVTPDGDPDGTKFKPASSIPTLSEWMLMMLALLLLLTGKREGMRLSGRKF